MRIACLHLPSFPLQIHVRFSPHLTGAAFAVTDHGERRAIVACSRAAWAEGVRPGMTSSQARALAPATQFVAADPELYRHALVALAESLLAHSLTVDIGAQYDTGSAISAHASIYLRVPPKQRAQRYGETLLAEILKGGYRARAGIADDRFTAWAAAVTSKSSSLTDAGNTAPFAQVCRVVARGGSAAYLAPLPLDLLPLSEPVRDMLRTLGTETLGAFAALPPPTVGRRWMRGGVDYQKLASGLGPTELTPFTPSERIIERIELEHEITNLEPLSFMLRPLADRVCRRLAGLGLAAEHVTLMLSGPELDRHGDRTTTEIDIEPSRPTLVGQTLVDLARAQLSELPSIGHSISEIALLVARTAEPEIEELDLFDYRDASASPDAVDIAIARLRAVFGDNAVGAAELVDSYRPEESFRLTPFSPPELKKQQKRKKRKGTRPKAGAKRTRKAARQEPALPLTMNSTCGALRLIEPPAPQPRGLRAISLDGANAPVITSRGPTRVEAEWWSGDPLERDYYEVETDDGGRYWVFQRADGRVFLHGIFD